MRIDAHQHIWDLNNAFCTWPTEAEAEIHRDFSLADLAPLLVAHNIDATVLVQAAPDIAETHDMLAKAEQQSFVRGVVGWIDIENTGAIADLQFLSANDLFKGIRPMLQGIADPLYILESRFDPVFRTLIERGLSFDALILPHQLQVVRELARRYPTLSIIIDHAAKPAIRDGQSGFATWSRDMARLADVPNVSCKISGLLTEAGPQAGLEDLQPFLDHLLQTFGSSRLLWGSDWPVLNMVASYASWHAITQSWLSRKPASDIKNIMGATAARVYRIVE
ncbi:MAG: amidohydrolase family protein [Parvibaculaceae bacterium]